MKTHILFVSLSLLVLSLNTSGQPIQDPAEEEAKAMIKQIYTEVSGQSGKMVDWDKVRSFFVKEAVIVLRTSREGSTQFTLDEFIQDFKNFYESPALGESGFKEEVLRVKAQVYGDAASIGVVYEANILDSDRPPQKGIDFWLLTRKDGSWKVVGVSNEIILPGKEIPNMFE